MSNNQTLLSCHNVSKSYNDGVQDINVLQEIDLAIAEGDRIAIVGPSGSGKSTLLHLLGGLDFPNKGDIVLKGFNWKNLSEKVRCQKRNNFLGFIYQFHHLLPELSALDNAMMPLCLADTSIETARAKASDVLTKLGLGHRLTHKPSELSGGERQRVAIARAIVHEPLCILADEPTGNLDTQTAEVVFEAFLALNKDRKTALVIVTHDLKLAEKMDRVYNLKDGKLT